MSQQIGRYKRIQSKIRLLILSVSMLAILGVNQGAGCGSKSGGGGGGSGLPGTPAGLSASGGDGIASLIWSVVSGANSYDVKRSTTTGGPYATVATAVLTNAYTDSGLTNGTTYFYVVVARNAAGTSGNSSQASVTPAVPITAPAAPTGLTSSAGDTTVSLIWNASAGASTYTVKRGTASGGPYGTTVATGITGTTYTDTGLTNGTTYYFVVSATNVVGTSANSIQTPATPTAPVVVPAAPGGLTATAGNNQVGLAWNSVSGATTYNVKRGTVSGGPYTTIATGLTVFTYLDNTAVNGTTYFYVVTASNSFGSSVNSSQVSATPAVPTVVPAAPANFAAAGSNGAVTVSWDFVSNAASYTVKRATVTGGPYTNVATGITALTYTDNTVTNGTTYFYVVVGVNAAGSSPNSNEASATPTAPPPAPTAPTGVTATSANTPSITVSWSTVAGATSYTVKRGTVSGGPYGTTVATGIATLTTTDLTVAANTTYYYVVIAVNGSGGSPNSSQATATTPPAAPTGITVTNGNGVVQLSWTPVTGATSYTVKRGTVNGGPYGTTVIAGLAAPSTQDSTVTNGTVYYYVIIAVGAGGNSQNSAQATGAPAATLPTTPTGLTATATTTPSVTVGWTAVAGATSYNIVRSSTSQSTGYTSLATAVVGTSYNDLTVVNNTTYWYTVQAVNGAGVGAYGGPPPSALVPTVAPGLPTLAATAAPAVNVSWSAVTGAVTYRVKRATVSGGPYTTVGTISAPTVVFTDNTVANGTVYYYVLTSDNGGIESAVSPENSVTTYPATPTGVSAVADNTPQVTISWTTVTGAASYKVYRGTVSGGPYGLTVGTVTAPTVNIVDALALNNNTYYYVVEATNVAGTSALSTQASATTPPAAPTGPLATSTNTPQIDLSWTAAAGATSYTVMRGTVSGTYSTTVATGVVATTYTDATTAVNTTYFYVIVAVGTGGNSQNSPEVSATTPPAAPTGLSATPSGTPDIALTWTASTGATSYSVYRGPSGTGPWTLVQAGVAVTNFTDTTVVNGTQYFYVVTALNAGGASQNSGSASATVPPAAPTALGATSAATPLRVDLTWTGSAGASTYTVLRGSASGGPYGTTVATGIATTTYSDSGVVVNTPYYYVVVAVNAGGSSGNSAEATATTPPAAPTGLAATGSATPQADLTWTAAAGATSYTIYRSLTTGGPFTQIATGIAVTTYTDTVVANGVTYFYTVSGVGAGGESAKSIEDSASMPPAAPTGVAVVSGNNPKINVSWNPVIGASSYNVKRGTVSGGPYGTTFSGVSGVNYEDNSAADNTQYFYVVTAVNAAGESVNSTEASATTPPAAPTGLGAVADNTPQISLTWTATTGATSYNVLRSTNSSGPFNSLATGVAVTNYVDTAVSGVTTYYYVVEAVGAGGTSNQSGSANAQTPADAPGGLTATPGNSQVGLSWPQVANASGYNIYSATVTGGPYTLLQNVGSATLTYTDGTVTNGTAYFYVVTATSPAGESQNSPEATATPVGTLPSAPTGLNATPGVSTVGLNWTAVGGATDYNVYRATSTGGPYSLLAANNVPNSYTDNTVTNGTQYFYVVTANNGGGESVYSNEAGALPQGVPSAPADLSVSPGNGQVGLSWSAVTDSGFVQYNIYRGTASGGPYTQIFSNLSGTSANSGGLTNGTAYFYVVRSTNGIAESANSVERTATPNPGPSVTFSNPANFATNVTPGTHLVVDFDLAMNTATTEAAISIVPALPFPMQFFWSAGNTRVTIVFDTITPAGIYGDDILAENTTYTVTIAATATSGGGTPMPGPATIEFTTTVDNTAPKVFSYTPDISTTSIASTTTQIDILFNEDMDTSRGGIWFKIGEGNSKEPRIGQPDGGLSLAWLGDNRTLRLTIAGGTLADSKIYTMEVSDCVDLANNWADGDEITFSTTGNGSDSTAPTITGIFPLNGATNVSRDTGIVLGFSEAMSPDAGNFVTFSANAAGIQTMKQLNGSPNVLLILPLKAWPANTTITVTAGTGVKDSSGNALAAPVSFTFTTGAGSGNPAVFDAPYSTLYDGINDVEPYMFSSDDRLYGLKFKDSVSGLRMAMNGQDLSASSCTLVEKATGLPIKGYQLVDKRNRGLALSIEGSRNTTGLKTSTVYTLTLNTGLQNSEGTPLAAPITFDLTTRGVGSVPSRPKVDLPESQYSTIDATVDEVKADLRLWVNSNAQVAMTHTVTASDSPDAGFAPTLTAQGTDYQYESSGDESTLSTVGNHTLTYTVSSMPGSYTQTVKDDVYIMDPANFPTLTGPGTIASSTPTYQWTSTAASGADAFFIQVVNVATDEEMLTILPDQTSTSIAQPSDFPLPSGTYRLTMILVKFQNGSINGGNIPGMGISESITFTVP